MGGGVDNGTLLVGFPVVVMITKAENVMSVGMEVLTDMVLLLALSDPWSTDPVVDKLEACEPVAEWEIVAECELDVPVAALRADFVRELDPFGFEGSVVVKDGCNTGRETTLYPRAVARKKKKKTQLTERVERAADSAALVEVVLLRCEDDIVEDCG